MTFEQFYLGCLAQASYLIGVGGRGRRRRPAPRRRRVPRTRRTAQGLRIRYVIETHLHADFVSGHRELAERTGAEIVFGAQRAGGASRIARSTDGDEMRVGRVVLRFLETPGHTPESISVLVVDTARSPEPRLRADRRHAVHRRRRPARPGGRSAATRPSRWPGCCTTRCTRSCCTLPDAVEVYPAHGAGSLCGKNISKETSSTIGEQRRTQLRAAADDARKRSCAMMTSRPAASCRATSRMDVEINRRGARRPRAPAAAAPLAPRRSSGARERGRGGARRARRRRLRRRPRAGLAERRPGRAVRVLGRDAARPRDARS